MKKIIILFCFLASLQNSFAQDKYIDSLKNVLAQSAKPIDRFSIIVKIAEYNLVLKGGAQDSTVPIQLLQLAQQLKNDSLLAISYNWAGSYLAFAKGDNTGALEYYFKAIPLSEKVRDKRRISSLYFDIALVYFVLQNNEEALKNIRKGGENLPDPSSPMYNFMLVQYQRNMSKYYLLSGRYDSALHYAQALTETSTTLKSLSFEYGALYLNGSTYGKMGDMEMADVYFKKAKEMTHLIQNSSGRLDFFEIYIRFLLSYKRINEVYEQAKQLMEWGNQNNNNNVKLSAAGFMQQVFDSLHQADSAYYYAKMKDNLNASIFSQDNINKTQALAFNEQLRIVEDNAKKTAEAQQRKENIQYALIALGIVTFLILFFMLSHSIIVNEKWISFFGILGLLIIFEFINLLIHPFLLRVTHHSPLLMLLALVAIASMLIPLHHRIEKWIKEKMTEKNKKIRLAAAKKTIEKLEKNQTN
ncbi:MAG: hypothetical protein ABI741_12195 [Ferruginibacter sp.]